MCESANDNSYSQCSMSSGDESMLNITKHCQLSIEWKREKEHHTHEIRVNKLSNDLCVAKRVSMADDWTEHEHE